MRTKYFLAAMALPLFAACTQDEFMGQGNENATSALQDRVKVGKVTLTDGNADTRINWETKQWEEGNVLGLFLMDETQRDQQIKVEEENNANKTWFMDQKNWNSMYALSNYYNTNFPFRFDATDHSWKNDDAVVEGNYFAIAPANNQQDHLKKLTNRRDAWLYINPVQKFGGKENATGELHELRAGIDENQFFLGYTQIYRNQELTSDETLQLPIQMRPILGMIDLAIMNSDEKPFKVEKIVVSRLDGSPMPTLAYVRPAGNTPESFDKRQDNDANLYYNQWNSKVVNDANLQKFDARFPDVKKGELEWQGEKTWVEYGPAFAQPYIYDNYEDKCGELRSNSYWSQATWTRTAARSVVEYSYPGQDGMIPYGCTGEMAKPAYEYVMDFTNDEGEGYLLNTNEFFHAYIALPHSMYLREYTFTMYGQQWNASRNRWEDGIIVPSFKDSYTGLLEGQTKEENDGRFHLQNLDLTTEKTYLEADIHFDDFNVARSRVLQTASADDLLKHLKMYYGENAAMDDNKNTFFYVETMGEFTITNELVDYVKMLNKNYATTTGSRALIYFTRTTGDNGYGELVFPKNLKATDAIDLFYYSKQVNLRNEGEQVITKPIIYNYEKSDLTLLKAVFVDSNFGNDRGFINDGVDLLDKIEPAIADKLFGGIGTITNVEGAKLTISKTIVDTKTTSTREAILNMEGAELIIDNSLIIAGRIDGNEMTILGTDFPNVTYIHNDGKMEMNRSIVFGTVENNNVLNVAGYSWITYLKNLTDEACTACGKQKAVTTISAIDSKLKMMRFWNTGIINANGNLYSNYSKNEGEVNINADSRISGQNFGVINVTDAALTPAFNKEQQEVAWSWSDDHLVNEATGVIYVKGDKKTAKLDMYYGNKSTRKIHNHGIIYVIGAADVFIEGGTGIIDVTEEAVGHQAKCNKTGEQFFRFRGVTNDDTLKELISSENWGIDKVILEFDEAKSYTQKGEAVAGSNVTNILIKNGAKVNLHGTWYKLERGNNLNYNDGIGGAYKALEVEAGSEMFVANDQTLITPSENEDREAAYLTINGYFHAQNRAKVGNPSWVFGTGTVEYYCKDADFTWLNKSKGSLNWHKK